MCTRIANRLADALTAAVFLFKNLSSRFSQDQRYWKAALPLIEAKSQGSFLALKTRIVALMD